MLRTQLMRFRGIVSSRGDASAHLAAPGDAVLVERGRPRLLIVSCPCGCGEEFPINLDSRAGPAWRLYRGNRGAVSVFPSVWRESGCRSHYIIWRDRILVLGQGGNDLDSMPDADEVRRLSDAVETRLPVTGLINFSEVAESMGAIPWDVLAVCRELVGRGRAREGTGDRQGWFGQKVVSGMERQKDVSGLNLLG